MMKSRRLCQTFFFAAWLTQGCAAHLPHEDLDPRQLDGPGYLALAESNYREHDYLRAQQYLDLAEPRLKSKADAQRVVQLGVGIAARAGRYDDAITQCQAALDSREDVALRRLLAVLYEAIGNLHAAEEQRNRIIRANPQQFAEVAELGRFYERTATPGSLKHAAEVYRYYLAASPHGPHAEKARLFLRSQPQSGER